ncbi:hypothetical protein E2C01_025879 [Portunus trituberculatus]|uniref:Uncharacterized protein n=1 Tax=Portunus trituberculatus TaxID=210409 RepID=A0A5B7EGP6_PORTR|nr:hypothetical protein [Portunus trituberculatus]
MHFVKEYLGEMRLDLVQGCQVTRKVRSTWQLHLPQPQQSQFLFLLLVCVVVQAQHKPVAPKAHPRQLCLTGQQLAKGLRYSSA